LDRVENASTLLVAGFLAPIKIAPWL
jgi:hypothetical protein